MSETTRPVGAVLTWEQYCAQVGVDPHAARASTVTQALCASIQRLDAATRRCTDTKPSCTPGTASKLGRSA